MTSAMLDLVGPVTDPAQISVTVWRPMADRAVEEVAKVHDFVTTDEVWDHLAKRGVPIPGEPKAMGPVMLAAVRRGILRTTSQTRNSTMPQNHHRPQRLYESLIHGDVTAVRWVDERPSPAGARCPISGCPEYNIKLEDSISSDVRLGSCPRHGRFAIGIAST